MELGLSHTGDNTAINIVKSDRRYDQDSTEVYHMGSNPKGYMLIIKYESDPRESSDSERDAQRVEELFLAVGYSVMQKRVSCIKDLFEKVEEFRKFLHDRTKVDSIFIYIIKNHKKLNYIPHFIEIGREAIPVDRVMWVFAGDMYFNGMPKVAFVQTTGDPALVTDEQFRSQCSKWLPPIPQDCLVVSYFQRGQSRSNAFLSYICDTITKNAHNTDLVTMMIEVYRHSFKKLYFNPGLYDPLPSWMAECEDPEDFQSFEIIVRKSEQRLDNNKSMTYKMGSRPKGYALVISNEKFTDDKHKERKGGDKDRDNLNKLLTGLGYEVTVMYNLTKADMEVAIINFRNKQEHKNVDSTIVFILSHGEVDGTNVQLITSDNLHIGSTWITDQFYGTCCPNLNGKPKLLFFQCCRGKDVEKVVTVESKVDTDGETKDFNLSKANFLIVYACAPGSVALRSPTCGSWFVHFMCKVFAANAHDTDVIQMLNTTSNKIMASVDAAMGTQVMCYTNQGFNKLLYFNPGLYDN